MKLSFTLAMTPVFNMTDYEMSTQEATSMSDEYFVDRHPINTALLYIIFFVGVPLNLSIIYLVMTVQQLRNLSNVILCTMCTGDFLMIVVMVPYEIFNHVLNITTAITKLVFVFNFFICGLSIFSLVMLSYDRHKAVTRPLEAEQTLKSNAIKVSVIVFLSALAAIPNYFYIIETNDGYYKAHLKYLVPGTFFILYLFPLLSICVLYTHMAITLTSGRKRVGESIKRHSKIGQQRNRTALIVLSLVIVFAICWFPFFYVLLYMTFFENPQGAFYDFSDQWRIIFFLLNSVFDPVSIYILGTRYRHHLFQTLPFHLFRKVCGKSNKESTTDSTMQSMLTSAGSYYRPTTRLNINKDDV